MANVIELCDVSKSFGKHKVLSNLSFTVPQGSVFAFLGNNGEGKSTTIRLITGLLKSDSGSVSVLGLNFKDNANTIKQKTGSLVEAPSLYPQLTAKEFLSITCHLKQLKKSEIDKTLCIVGLLEAKHRRIGHFSLGMKQRLALANALLGSPQLVVLDEPTNGLDPQGMQDIRELIKDLPNQMECTVFLSSHLLDEVEKVASHVALLRNGVVEKTDELSKITQSSEGYLTLEVENQDKAHQILLHNAYNVSISGSSLVRVTGLAKSSVTQVNQQLIEQNVPLIQSIYHQPSLEEWFLKTNQR
ncbi:ABC transporter ATP-binding protein [Pleionea sediminis]|uniref:ABC transporter ATP-binding protein n=1 Tax=Pleionea sediminis TaxID=2569479 RepID=UPI001186B791|nr:ATP-binding cassette domain-containing protein [Pleionea sediminis]